MRHVTSNKNKKFNHKKQWKYFIKNFENNVFLTDLVWQTEPLCLPSCAKNDQSLQNKLFNKNTNILQ